MTALVPDHIRFRVGRRGALLLVFGVLHIGLGLSTLVESPTPPGQDPYIFQALPEWLRLGLWTSLGLVAIAHAWTPPWRRDSWGWFALVPMLVWRIYGYIAAWVDYAIDGVGGRPGAWSSALLFGSLLSAILVIAGWPEVRTDDSPDEIRARLDQAVQRKRGERP